jgi:putative exosortase-associated protein (TIGR04073 family)
MLNRLSFLAMILVVGGFAVGCANTEQKFGRGLSNTMEPVRLGDLRRSMEQTAMFYGPEAAYTTGFIKGLNKTLARTGVGIYEMVTCPFPSYDPIFTNYLTPGASYPDNYRPDIIADSTFATDTNLRFSGGEVVPVLGSRFKIFDSR